MELLQELVSIPGTPGREHRIREFIIEQIEEIVDEYSVDTMGNLIAIKRATPTKSKKKAKKKTSSSKATRVMLAAHMDQIGFMVKHVDSQGYVHVNPTGGFDPRNLFARNAIVCTSDGDYPAVMNPGIKPTHIASPEERKAIPDPDQFYVDMGMTEEEVKAVVKIGDMVVLDAHFRELGHSVASQCLDNRVGCWAVIKALKNVKKHSCDIYAVFTVQEEVGLRGATTASYGVEPDIAISCDTTVCAHVPGVPEQSRVTVPGDGICVKVMDSSMIGDINFVEELEAVGAKNDIKVQRALLPRGGQDGAMIQRSKAGIKTGVLACPLKYIHTVIEMAHKDDLEAYHKLLVAWLEGLK